MDYTILRKKDGRIIWTEAQIAYIVKEYQSGLGTGKLAERFNTSTQSIRNVLRENNVKVRTLNEQQTFKFPRNSNFFKEESSDMYYWLGFLYADGCVASKGNTISITTIDKEHLEKFRSAIGATNNTISSSVKKINDKEYPLYHFSIKDKTLHKDLISLGCTPRKSLTLIFPNIPNEQYLYDFIRGYFDGDGSINYTTRKNTTKANNKNYRISFIGTKAFLTVLKEKLGVEKLALQYGVCGEAYLLQITGNKKVENILSKVYNTNNPKETHLDRKYNKYIEFKLFRSPLSLNLEI